MIGACSIFDTKPCFIKKLTAGIKPACVRLALVCLGRVLRILLTFWTILCYDNLSLKWCRFKVYFEVNYFDHVTIIEFVYHLIAGFRYYRNESPKSNPTISCDCLPLILHSRTTLHNLPSPFLKNPPNY